MFGGERQLGRQGDVACGRVSQAQLGLLQQQVQRQQARAQRQIEVGDRQRHQVRHDGGALVGADIGSVLEGRVLQQ